MSGLRAVIGAAAATVALATATGLPVAGAAPIGPDSAPAQGSAPAETSAVPADDESAERELAAGEENGNSSTGGAVAGEPPAQVPEPGADTGRGPETGEDPGTDSDRRAETAVGVTGDPRGDGGAAHGRSDTTKGTETEDLAADSADRGALRVTTGPIRVTATAGVGGILTALIDVAVADTRPDSAGWAVDVRAADPRGAHGAGFPLDDRSYYRAGDTVCSRGTGPVALTAAGAVSAVAPAACPRAQWSAELGIAVPADVPLGDYRLTVTHSVY